MERRANGARLRNCRLMFAAPPQTFIMKMILASEIPRIAQLLDSAEARTIRLSRNCRATK